MMIELLAASRFLATAAPSSGWPLWNFTPVGSVMVQTVLSVFGRQRRGEVGDGTGRSRRGSPADRRPPRPPCGRTAPSGRRSGSCCRSRPRGPRRGCRRRSGCPRRSGGCSAVAAASGVVVAVVADLDDRRRRPASDDRRPAIAASARCLGGWRWDWATDADTGASPEWGSVVGGSSAGDVAAGLLSWCRFAPLVGRPIGRLKAPSGTLIRTTHENVAVVVTHATRTRGLSGPPSRPIRDPARPIRPRPGTE